jgi:uncharacterized protein (DUF849 family)
MASDRTQPEENDYVFHQRLHASRKPAAVSHHRGAIWAVTVLHLHVRDPKTGHGSKNFNDFNEQIARLRKAVPKMIIQVGGSISFAPDTDAEKAQWLGYDTRHMLTDLNPKPDQTLAQQHPYARLDTPVTAMGA